MRDVEFWRRWSAILRIIVKGKLVLVRFKGRALSKMGWGSCCGVAAPEIIDMQWPGPQVPLHHDARLLCWWWILGFWILELDGVDAQRSNAEGNLFIMCCEGKASSMVDVRLFSYMFWGYIQCRHALWRTNTMLRRGVSASRWHVSLHQPDRMLAFFPLEMNPLE